MKVIKYIYMTSSFNYENIINGDIDSNFGTIFITVIMIIYWYVPQIIIQ